MRTRGSREQRQGRTWVFLCNDETREDCLDKRVFGSGKQKAVQKGDTLLLHDFEEEETLGAFKAVTDIRNGIVPGLWGGRFSWQVRVSWDRDQLYKIQHRRLPHQGLDFDEAIPPRKADDLIRVLETEGEPWPPENRGLIEDIDGAQDAGKRVVPGDRIIREEATTVDSTGRVELGPEYANEDVRVIVVNNEPAAE